MGVTLEDSSREPAVPQRDPGRPRCFSTNPAVNLAIIGASLDNLIFHNQLSARRRPGRPTDSNIGCKD